MKRGSGEWMIHGIFFLNSISNVYIVKGSYYRSTGLILSPVGSRTSGNGIKKKDMVE